MPLACRGLGCLLFETMVGHQNWMCKIARGEMPRQGQFCELHARSFYQVADTLRSYSPCQASAGRAHLDTHHSLLISSGGVSCYVVTMGMQFHSEGMPSNGHSDQKHATNSGKALVLAESRNAHLRYQAPLPPHCRPPAQRAPGSCR